MNEAEVLYPSYIANSVFNGFSAYAAIMLNIVTVHAIRRTTSLPNRLKTLLLSLAVSDLCVGFVVQPFYITLLVFRRLRQDTESDPDYNKKPFLIVTELFFLASFFGNVAISVDRFLAIHLHLRYQELVTHKRVVAAVVAFWLLSAFLSLTNLWKSKHVICVVVFGVCVICTTVVYLRIYFAVRRHRIQIRAQQLHQDLHNTERVNFLKLRKSAIGTFYVYVVFLLCYLPGYFAMVSHLIVSKPNTAIKALRLYSWTLIFLNSSLNPVVYCWKMRHIRHTIVDLLRNKFIQLWNA